MSRNLPYPDTFCKKAFDIGYCPEVIDVSVPPTTGIEYLQRVHLEYMNAPKVVRADLDTKKFDPFQTVTIDGCNGMKPAPPGFCPSIKWQRLQTLNFTKLRLKLQSMKKLIKQKSKKRRFPERSDGLGWCSFCLGTDVAKVLYLSFSSRFSGENKFKIEKQSLDSDGKGQPPLLSIVVWLSQPTIGTLLSFNIRWLGDLKLLSRQQGQWIYSLLASLEKPLIPNICSLLRKLVRLCAELRSNLKNNDETLSSLNLIICLVANYFDQKDMIDTDTHDEDE